MHRRGGIGKDEWRVRFGVPVLHDVMVVLIKIVWWPILNHRLPHERAIIPGILYWVKDQSFLHIEIPIVRHNGTGFQNSEETSGNAGRPDVDSCPLLPGGLKLLAFCAREFQIVWSEPGAYSNRLLLASSRVWKKSSQLSCQVVPVGSLAGGDKWEGGVWIWWKCCGIKLA